MSVDWAVVRHLRDEVAETLSSENLAHREQVSRIQALIPGVVARHCGTPVREPSEEARLLAAAVRDALLGLGRIQPLMDDPRVENIEISGSDQVVVERTGGEISYAAPVAENDQDLIDEIVQLAARSDASREFSTLQPLLNLRLPDGSRLAASRDVSPRPQVTIRRHRLRDISLAMLVRRHMMTESTAQFLSEAVEAEKSIMVSGPQGVGKTTLLRALCSELDPWTSVGTIETEAELFLHEFPAKHRRVRSFEARQGIGEVGANGARAGEVTLSDLTESAWRHNLDRIVLGEVRGREALSLMQIMGGVRGAMWTIHGASCRGALDRMVSLMLLGNVPVAFAQNQVAAHTDLVVQLRDRVVDKDGQRRRHRFVAEVASVEAGENGAPALTTLQSSGGAESVENFHLRHQDARQLSRVAI